MSRKLISKDRLQYSLDVLTDGSEYTGHGTVFLTVTRKSAYLSNMSGKNMVDGEEDVGESILARYAITGLSSLTARLAADQSYKISYVRAVFIPYRSDVLSTAGISSLLLSLSNHSKTGTLNIVGPAQTSDLVEELSKLILGLAREYPRISTCDVPSKTDCWWVVYEDEYILVHARPLHACQEHGDGVAYIITIPCHSDSSEDPDKYSFAVFPPYISLLSLNANMCEPLPDAVCNDRIRIRPPFKFILLCDPNVDSICSAQEPTFQTRIHPSLLNLSKIFMMTYANAYFGNNQWDHGLLIRAAQQSLHLHSSMPWAFPLRFNNTTPSPTSEPFTSSPKLDASFNQSYEMNRNTSVSHYYKLNSCMTVILKTCSENEENLFLFIDRRKRLWTDFENDKEMNPKLICVDTSLPVDGSAKNRLTDPNEIDLNFDIPFTDFQPSKRPRHGVLSDEIEVNNQFSSAPSNNNYGAHQYAMSVPHILILGTGCAAPASLRGSSGYGLFMPSTNISFPSLKLMGLIECGEGCLTSLSRFVPQQSTISFQDQISSLQWIWISHAHLDHYGELPVLIQYLGRMRGHPCQCFTDSRGLLTIIQHTDDCQLCQRCRKPLPLLVIAPTKVLTFVDLLLNSVDGIAAKSRKRLFVGFSHKDFDCSTNSSNTSQRSTNHREYRYCIQNVPVKHCTDSFALILRLQWSGAHVSLCYSGDTRPCQRLAQACQSEFHVTGKRISLLIHEATFDDDQPMDALKKSHSTVSEALRIFEASGSKSCILSHFSQRYPRIPPSVKPSSSSRPYGMAADGMLIPCDETILNNLGKFNAQVHEILEQLDNSNSKRNH